MFKTLLPLKSFLPFLLSVFCTLTYAQTGTVTGTILDEKAQTAIGATVKLKGTGNGAATDINGKFAILNVPVGDQILVVSFIGYQPQEIKVTVKEGINTIPDINLKTDALMLNDVVVVGYGTQVKREMSSSVATVKSEDLEDKPVYDFTSAMTGEAAGVQVTTDNGLAGSSAAVRIRGVKTLSDDAEPLYVIDGVPIVSYDISNADANFSYNVSPLSNINPNDIASIEVLKDASATSIYGARGANGVIIVTTKQGKAGKTKVDINTSAGVTQAAHILPMLNAQQFLQEYDEASRLDGGSSTPALPNSLPYSQIANTNWLKQALGTGYFTENNVSASGGDSKTTFYIDGGLRDDKGFIIGNAFKRGSFRLNLNHVVNKWFTIGGNTSTTYTHNQYVPTAAAGGLGAAQSYALPIYPVFNPGGTPYFFPNNSAIGSLAQGNPIAEIDGIVGSNDLWRNISNTYFSINPIPELTFRNDFGIDMMNQLESFYEPSSLTGTSNLAYDRRDFYFTWNYSSTLDYKKDINDNNSIEALVGWNPTETTEHFSYIQGKDIALPSQNQVQNANPDSISGTAGTGRQYAFNSVFSRVNYKLKNRYLFQVSFRADGSSRFGPDNKYGYFPAGSFGWIMTDEKFLKHQNALSFLKFRASLGTTGNASFTDDWPYLAAFTSNQNYAGTNGVGPSTVAVPDLKWETTLKADVGFDYGFWNNRISGLIDLYRENTYNLLVQGAPLTPSSGYTSVTENLGSLYNQGIEWTITTNNLKPTSALQWTTTLNFAANQNKVTNLGGVAEVTGTNYGNNAAVVGQPVGVWLLAQYAGVNPETGQPMIDSAGHKVVANATNTVALEKPVGNPYPKFQGGLKNTFKFWNFQLDVMLTYSVGGNIYDDDGKRQDGNLAYGWNQTTNILNGWTQPGQVTNVARLSLTQNYDYNSTEYLYNASFLKLKNLTLGYNFPTKITAKMKMRALRVYVSVQNVATATKYPGWDPETNRDNSGAITQSVSYLNSPQARVFSLGLSIGF